MEYLKDLPINVVDLAVITVLMISAIFAYARGFIYEALSTGRLIAAVALTFFGYPHVQPYARELVAIELLADVGTGIAIFIVTLTVLALLTRSLSRPVQDSALNILDRSLGFLFGLLRGAVIISVAFIAVELLITRNEQPPWIREAKSMPLIVQGADLTRDLTRDVARRIFPSFFVEPEDQSAASGSPSPDASGNSGSAFDSEAVVKQLQTLLPKAEITKPEGAYGNKERRELERLLDSTSEQPTGEKPQ